MTSQPGLGVQVLVLFGVFLGGGAAGIYLSDYVAPNSGFAAAVGTLTFVGSLFIGLQLWAGTTIVLGLGRLLLLPFRGRRPSGSSEVRPAGGFVFVPLTVAISLGAGILIGLFTTAGIVNATLVFGGAGLVYGIVLWLSARTGCLPFMLE